MFCNITEVVNGDFQVWCDAQAIVKRLSRIMQSTKPVKQKLQKCDQTMLCKEAFKLWKVGRLKKLASSGTFPLEIVHLSIICVVKYAVEPWSIVENAEA